MRRVPRLGGRVIAQALAVDGADHRGALGAAGPIAAGSVVSGWKCTPVRLRACQHVVVVGRIADTGNHGAALGQRGLHAELVVVAVKLVDVLSDNFAFEILPRSPSHAGAGVDGFSAARCLRAEIGAPRLAAGAGALR